MSPRIYPLALVVFLLLPTSGLASRARVEASGNLEFLLEDETAQLDPFRVGNPAGLALLPRVNRLDVSGQWRYEEFNRATSIGVERSIRRTFSTLPSLTGNDLPQYNGLMVFPVKGLALQASGSMYHQDDVYDFSDSLSDINRQKGFARAAYDLGPVQLGVEGQLRGATEDIAPGLLAPGIQLEEGTITSQQNTATGGLLFQFPLKPANDRLRLRLGGVYTLMPMSPDQKQEYLIWETSSSLRAHYNVTYRIKDYMAYGPDVFLEVPGRFQAGLFLRMNSASGTVEEDVPEAPVATHVPEYKAVDTSTTYAGLGFKAVTRTGGSTDLRWGAFLSMDSSKTDQFSPAGIKTAGDEPRKMELHLGLGVSRAEDYSAGLQYSLRTAGGDRSPVGGTALPREAADQAFILGGENWFSPEWAYRIGITSQLVENRGKLPYRTDLYGVDPESRVFASLLTAGFGYKSPGVGADLRLHIGQASYLSGVDDKFATLAGMLLSLTTFF